MAYETEVWSMVKYAETMGPALPAWASWETLGSTKVLRGLGSAGSQWELI